jgi:hypothetical protein
MMQLTTHGDFFTWFDVFQCENIESQGIVVETPHSVRSTCVVDTLLDVSNCSSTDIS